MAGISSQAAGKLEDKYKYNGNEIEHKEFSDGSGLETMDFNARMFDHQLGRFWQQDPLGEYTRRWSLYVFAYDNPVRFSDPTGLIGKGDTIVTNHPEDTPGFNGNVDDDGSNVTVTTTAKSGNGGGFWSGVGNVLWGAVDYIPFAGSIKQIGVGIYHGDWKEIAMGTVGLGVDIFTGGEGGEALRVGEKGLQILAEDEVKELAEKEFAENVEKDVAEDVEKDVAEDAEKTPCGCFLPGTLILTDTGYKKIENIKVGDLVWAFNDTTGEFALKRVVHVFEHIRDTVYQIHIGAEVINTTSDHPFFIAGRWLRVKNLHVGDSVITYTGNKIAITAIKIVAKHVTVHNFEVSDYHTYYVSSAKILVHNNDPCPNKLPKPAKGKGKVPKSQRDSKRAWTRNERGEMLDGQGGKCIQCGEAKSVDEVQAHHINRHADGFPTVKENGAAVCTPCHVELHH